ncbi:MAG: ABC transporter ATP-binding protein [Candidatus Cloacimonetes bacterium]|nr:ABC transporter ATP-binding protein [Candidatus Cloacimonadota bacterium]
MDDSIIKEHEYSGKLDIKLWKKVLSFAAIYKKHMIILAIVMIFIAGIDAVFPILTKDAIDNYIVPGNLNGLKSFAVKYALFVIFQAVNVWFLVALAGKIDMGIVYDIRKASFDKLQNLSLSYFDKTPIGWIMARVSSDCSRIGDTIAWGLVNFVWGIALMVVISIILLIMNWKLALAVLTVVPPLVLISLKFQKLILNSYRKSRRINSLITSAFNEGITGAKTSKTLVREEHNLEEFIELTDKMKTYSMKASVQSALYLPSVLILGTIGSGIAIWLGGNGVIAGKITYGTLVAFISYVMTFFEPVQELARNFAELQSAQASAERIFSLLETEIEVKDDEIIKSEYVRNPSKFFYRKNQAMKGDVEFDNVTFRYNTGETVLHNFNFKVSAGQSIALVGETGSGKSTIVNLICRFYEPVEGKILIDGKDYKNLPLEFIQSNIGVVLQTPHLFSGTVMENIRYGKLNATNNEIYSAAKLVNADKFIKLLPKGYETEVEEGGNSLSTGQKQLITFARAVLANPSILILDEATSSVDTETELLIQEALDNLLLGRTSFIVAHRLSTIRSADVIIVLENGKIIESGNHHELIVKGGHYHKLYTNQYIEENESKQLSA